MRFMIIVKATADSETGRLPTDAEMGAMAAFHEEMANAGIVLDASGLKPSAAGFRVRFGADGARTVVDGPFAETKELIAGYTIISVRSREEALAWARRFPCPYPSEEGFIEVRQLYELDDFVPSPGVETFRAIERVTRPAS